MATQYKIVNGQKIELTRQEILDRQASTDARVAAKEALLNTKGHVKARDKAYAAAFSIGDQIDLIQKQLVDMVSKGQIALLPDTQNWLDTIQQIKTDIPKGRQPKPE